MDKFVTVAVASSTEVKKEKNLEEEEEEEEVVVVGPIKTVHWDDFEQELARLVSLSSALTEARERKFLLQQKLQSLMQVEVESLNKANQLHAMREKLESRKLAMVKMSRNAKVTEENVLKEEEHLGNEIRSLLVAGTGLSIANKHLQEANRTLAGERGFVHLRNVQKLLRLRQQYMISQVSLIYPVKVKIGQAREQELESFTSSGKVGSDGSKPIDQGPLTISGHQLTVLPFKMSFFSDKKELQRSATALGYVAHVVSLIASYLGVALRYSVRLGGSRSYVLDNVSSLEPSSSDSASSSLVFSYLKPTEFPLFLDGQDTTRAAYAMFLLNKDIEQLLNFIGAQSLGPRHILANLKELLRTILSSEYTDS